MNDNENNLARVLSVTQLAEILHIGRNSAYTLVNSGRIRNIRVGNRILIPQSALLDFLNKKS